MLYFIVNEKSRSGKGAEIWSEVRTALDARHIRYQAYTTEYEGHARLLAEEISSRGDGEICLVAVGGDGTANEVLNGIGSFERVRFGTIPTGSGNDLARGLHITGTPTENLVQILDCMAKPREENLCMDLGQVSWNGCGKPRIFAISSGIGLDALVCKKALKSKLKDVLNKVRLGKLTYVFLTVASLFSMETADAAIQAERTKPQRRKRVIYAAAMNFAAEGGGVRMAPAADAADGRLSVCIASGILKWRTFFYLPLLVAGKHTGIRGFEVNDCGTFRIKLNKPMVLHADGEYCGDVTEAVFACLPHRLYVLRQADW